MTREKAREGLLAVAIASLDEIEAENNRAKREFTNVSNNKIASALARAKRALNAYDAIGPIDKVPSSE